MFVYGCSGERVICTKIRTCAGDERWLVATSLVGTAELVDVLGRRVDSQRLVYDIELFILGDNLTASNAIPDKPQCMGLTVNWTMMDIYCTAGKFKTVCELNK